MTDIAQRRLAYDRLLAHLPQTTGEPRWHLLMAAHVIGQGNFRLHAHSHLLMLREAIAQRDAREAAGQLLRLALNPIGHLLDRLPQGNTGRSNVSPFAPMTPPGEVRAWLDAVSVPTARVPSSKTT